MFLKTVLRIIRSLLFVDRCVVCHDEGSVLHTDCVAHFAVTPPHRLSWIHSVWHYQDPAVKDLIYILKKKADTDILETCLQNISSPFSSDYHIVIPIPASPDRMRQYGFNQAYLLAKQFVVHNPAYQLCDALMHTDTPSTKQALVSDRSQRLQNKKGCFTIKESYAALLSDKHIIVIDDVSTTGATLIEARRALAHAAPASIQAWTLGH